MKRDEKLLKRYIGKVLKKQKSYLSILILVLILNSFINMLIINNINNRLKDNNIALREIELDIMNKKEKDKNTHELPVKDLGTFNLTFYTPTELGATSANQLLTATGTVPKEGRTIAVDPRIIKKGSIVYIEDWGYYIAEDTGSAIKGKRIDIFLDSYEMAKQLGNNKKAKVYLIR